MSLLLILALYTAYCVGVFTVGQWMRRKSIQAWDGKISETISYLLFPVSTFRFYDGHAGGLIKWKMIQEEERSFPPWLRKWGIRRLFEIEEKTDSPADSDAREWYSLMTGLFWPFRLVLNFFLGVGVIAVALWYVCVVVFCIVVVHYPKKDKTKTKHRQAFSFHL